MGWDWSTCWGWRGLRLLGVGLSSLMGGCCSLLLVLVPRLLSLLSPLGRPVSYFSELEGVRLDVHIGDGDGDGIRPGVSVTTRHGLPVDLDVELELLGEVVELDTHLLKDVRLRLKQGLAFVE